MRSCLLPLLTLLLLPQPARANGQSTHVWITLEALEALPDGPVRELLTRPELRDPLVNGTMFPDGGYPQGLGYGELAHWEPFQQAYLGWIQETYLPPYDTGEAAEHVAFLFGMASHGMADENFDSLFMERSRCFDPGWDDPESQNLDTASDVLFMYQVGGIELAESWLPVDALLEVFRERMNHEVSEDALDRGHVLLHLAVTSVDWIRKDPVRLEDYLDSFPWAEAHLSDHAEPGSPWREAQVVAGYWEELWRRLQGPAPFDAPVLEVVPADGDAGHPSDATLPEARVHFSFSRGVSAETLHTISVTDEEGTPVPIHTSHFYGDYSHAVLVTPLDDWAEDMDFRVSLAEGLTSYEGDSFEGGWSSTFSTRAPVVIPPPGEPPPDPPPPGCACTSGHRSSGSPAGLLVLLLGFTRARRRSPLHKAVDVPDAGM